MYNVQPQHLQKRHWQLCLLDQKWLSHQTKFKNPVLVVFAYRSIVEKCHWLLAWWTHKLEVLARIAALSCGSFERTSFLQCLPFVANSFVCEFIHVKFTPVSRTFHSAVLEMSWHWKVGWRSPNSHGWLWNSWCGWLGAVWLETFISSFSSKVQLNNI